MYIYPTDQQQYRTAQLSPLTSNFGLLDPRFLQQQQQQYPVSMFLPQMIPYQGFIKTTVSRPGTPNKSLNESQLSPRMFSQQIQKQVPRNPRIVSPISKQFQPREFPKKYDFDLEKEFQQLKEEVQLLQQKAKEKPLQNIESSNKYFTLSQDHSNQIYSSGTFHQSQHNLQQQFNSIKNLSPSQTNQNTIMENEIKQLREENLKIQMNLKDQKRETEYWNEKYLQEVSKAIMNSDQDSYKQKNQELQQIIDNFQNQDEQSEENERLRSMINSHHKEIAFWKEKSGKIEQKLSNAQEQLAKQNQEIQNLQNFELKIHKVNQENQELTQKLIKKDQEIQSLKNQLQLQLQ